MTYPSRKKDRHKSPKDRHKNRNQTRKTEPWRGEFIAVDGEGWDGKYCILAMTNAPPLVNLRGLSTRECLHYLTRPASPKSAYIGFGLSYDFENILKDIPDNDYLALLTESEKLPKIVWENYTISYIPRKILEISKEMTGRYGAYTKTVVLQDVWGFFQCSFVEALKKWEIEIPENLLVGKEERATFSAENLKEIISYNKIELEKLVNLMEKLREADLEACNLISLKPNHTPRGWYGPGARATNFLNQTNFVKEHPPFTGEVFEKLCSLVPKEASAEPFSASFYGGRIEAATKGIFTEKMYDYDLNSAYPYAVSLLPAWEPEDLTEVTGYDGLNRIGIYFLEWEIKEKLGFYPFPFRSSNGNVFFPSAGSGWYMSPEVSAARELYGSQIKIAGGFVLKNTENGGCGQYPILSEKLCSTAKKMAEMATVRLQAKTEKRPAERVLKLTMNSCYGKTIQQVGSRKFLNLFTAAWITSVCRAELVRAIGKDKEDIVISIMTDGILARRRLGVIKGSALGEWTETEIKHLIQCLPGVYQIETSSGEKITRYRGMSKNFDVLAAVRSFYLKNPFILKTKVFVTRRLAINIPNKYGNYRYHFVEIEKEENFSLNSKRTDSNLPGKFLLPEGEDYRFFPAKRPDLGNQVSGSKPYVLNLPAVLAYDTAKTEEELKEDRRLPTILEQEEL